MRLIDADALLDKYVLNIDKRNNILIAQTDYAPGRDYGEKKNDKK